MSKNFIAFDFGDGTTTAAAYEEGGLVETLNILPGVDEIDVIKFLKNIISEG